MRLPYLLLYTQKIPRLNMEFSKNRIKIRLCEWQFHNFNIWNMQWAVCIYACMCKTGGMHNLWVNCEGGLVCLVLCCVVVCNVHWAITNDNMDCTCRALSTHTHNAPRSKEYFNTPFEAFYVKTVLHVFILSRKCVRLSCILWVYFCSLFFEWC